MRILLASQQWPAFGGSETYLVTIGLALQRFGHRVELYAPAGGEVAEMARESGLPALTEAGELPARPDVVVSQDGATAAELAAAFPESRRVYVTHAPFYEPQRPPLLDGACHAIVALSDPAAAHVDALASHPEVVRLRQPIDLERFRERSEPRPEARRALAFGHHWGGERSAQFQLLADACERLGLELRHIGRLGDETLHPEIEIANADIVVGVGRCVLEGMAGSRAVYVLGPGGWGGWVTPERYPVLEGRAFTGDGATGTVGPERLVADLAAYDPDMGRQNRQLVLQHHGSARHAVGLIQLFERLQPSPAAEPERLDALARMTRVQWETERRAATSEWDARNIRLENDRLRAELEAAHAELDAARGEAWETRARLDALLAGRRYRLGSLLLAPFARLARLVGRARARWKRRHG